MKGAYSMVNDQNTPNDQSILIEQYKLYVEMMDRVSLRRNDANKFFITLLTTLLAFLTLVVENNLFNSIQSWSILAIGVIGVALCTLWNLNILSYKQLNSLKFDVIHEMEKELPYPSYSREWEILGNKNKKYRRLTEIERYIPYVFLIPFVILIIFSLIGLVS